MPSMPTTKVTRGYQVTIPEEVRSKAGIRIGDMLIVDYDEKTGTIRIRRPARGRSTAKLGRRISVEEIEESIERGLGDCLRS